MTTNAFIVPPEVPTQAGPENVFYDFNDGARILLPEGKWHVRIIDDESGNILFAYDVDRKVFRPLQDSGIPSGGKYPFPRRDHLTIK